MCTDVKRTGLLWLVALAFALAGRATSSDQAGLNDSTVVASSRKDVTSILSWMAIMFVVSDSNKSLWLVRVLNPRQYPVFEGSKEYAAFSSVVSFRSNPLSAKTGGSSTLLFRRR